MANNKSPECILALELLARSRNVLISGPPGTGKSKLLAEVAAAFEAGLPASAPAAPPHAAGASVPVPAVVTVTPSSTTQYPAPTKTNRKVFRTVFHQNSKYRDFISGLTPTTVNGGAGKTDFRVMEGTLYKASKHALLPDGASLLIIDEINRGPAVQVFGGSIVAIESDKRLAPDGKKRLETQYFELLDPNTGEVVEYALPHDLYILSAMNQADASVEPLDVAFLRRWEPLRLDPDLVVLRTWYGLPAVSDGAALPASPATAADCFEVAARAWAAVNDQISVGRGPEFQIGHGVLMGGVSPGTLSMDEALAFLCVGWAKICSHVEEVFFGDIRGVATALNALDGPKYNPFKLTETTFAGELRYRMTGPRNFSTADIYPALRAFSRE